MEITQYFRRIGIPFTIPFMCVPRTRPQQRVWNYAKKSVEAHDIGQVSLFARNEGQFSKTKC